MNKIKQKGTLSFDLEEPSSKRAFRRASNADEAYLALWQMAELLGRVNNDGYTNGPYYNLEKLLILTPEHTDEDGDTVLVGETIIRTIQKCFHDLLERYNVNLDDLD